MLKSNSKGQVTVASRLPSMKRMFELVDLRTEIKIDQATHHAFQTPTRLATAVFAHSLSVVAPQ